MAGKHEAQAKLFSIKQAGRVMAGSRLLFRAWTSTVTSAVAPVEVAVCGDGVCSGAMGEDTCWCPGDCDPGAAAGNLSAPASCPSCSSTPYYQVTIITENSVNPVAAGHTLLNLGDDASQAIPLPFVFRFHCYDYVVRFDARTQCI